MTVLQKEKGKQSSDHIPPYRVVVWGMEQDYLRVDQLLRFEILKGNLEVEALVCRAQDKYCSSKDGYPVLTHEQIAAFFNPESKSYPDFVIICINSAFAQIRAELVRLYHYPAVRVLSSSIFLLPCFDFALYANLVLHPVSIIGNDCLAGLIYKRLRLQYTTPLMWTLMATKEYLKLLEHPLEFMQNGLYLRTESNPDPAVNPEEDRRKELFEQPIKAMDDNLEGELRYQNQTVMVKLPHYRCFEEAETKYKRRLARLNTQNLFFLFCGHEREVSPEITRRLQATGYPYVCAIFQPDLEHNIFTAKYPDHVSPYPPMHYWQYMHAKILEHIDVLKMLNGEMNFMRDVV